MTDWITTHETADEDSGLREKTELLELPHGCLVRQTTVQGNDGRFLRGGNRVAVALEFVPNLKLERHADTTVEFVYKH